MYRNRHATAEIITEAVVEAEVKRVGEEIESAAALIAAVTELELRALAGGHAGALQHILSRHAGLGRNLDPVLLFPADDITEGVTPALR